ncbi:MAG: VRR-NUC domain-containing protein [Patescibacteria group bacterium]
MSPKPEFIIQKALASYMTLFHPDVLTTCSVAGIFVNMGIVMKMAAMGYRKGTPDYFVLRPCGGFHGLFLELKAEGKKASPEQRAWHSWAKKEGYKTAVCDTYEKAVGEIEAYLALPRRRILPEYSDL